MYFSKEKLTDIKKTYQAIILKQYLGNEVYFCLHTGWSHCLVLGEYFYIIMTLITRPPKVYISII